MKIKLMPHTPFLNYKGTFNLEEAILYSATIAGVCYNEEGFVKLLNENMIETQKRVKTTMNYEHHSVYDHINIGLEISNIPKIVAMIINNEKDYNTSEKSSRYTKIVKTEDSIITETEEVLYNKWLEIFKDVIAQKYSHIHKPDKIKKLSQENARYMITVFAPTEMIYTVPLGQLNKIISFMKKYIAKENKSDFDAKVIQYLKEFVEQIDLLNLTHPLLQTNSKERSLSIFSEREKKNEFGETFSINYQGSFASYAQMQRHRTLSCEMKPEFSRFFFIPPIIGENIDLVHEWLDDINSVANVYPQGMMVDTTIQGKYADFILMLKERKCTNAQLEINDIVTNVVKEYVAELKKSDHVLFENLEKYDRGARCTFPDYTCLSDCKFPEGKILTRKI